MISRHSSVPPYLQIAAHLREQIAAGELAPGVRLPAYSTLAHQYGVGVGTVTRAMQQLRDAGLIESGTGSATYVREQPPRLVIELPTGGLLDSRMPTLQERERLHMDPGVPVFELTGPDGKVTTFPADRYRFTSR